MPPFNWLLIGLAIGSAIALVIAAVAHWIHGEDKRFERWMDEIAADPGVRDQPVLDAITAQTGVSALAGVLINRPPDDGRPADFVTYSHDCATGVCQDCGLSGCACRCHDALNTYLDPCAVTWFPNQTIPLPRRGNWRSIHLENVTTLDRAKVIAAVEFLKSWMGDSLDMVRTLGRDNDEWWTEYQFFSITAVRNALRINGFGERELGIPHLNLDDYAVGLVELAAGLTDLPPEAVSNDSGPGSEGQAA